MFLIKIITSSRTVPFILSCSFLLTCFIGYLDYLSGEAYGFFLFYLIPIFLATIYGRLYKGIIIALISTVTWFWVDYAYGIVQVSLFSSLWNAFIRAAIFIVIPIFLWRIKFYYNKFRDTVDFIIHDLRTPLSNIMAGLDLALNVENENLTAQQKKYLFSCRTSGIRMNILINSILDFSKLENKKFTLKITEFDIESLIQTSLEVVQQFATKKQISLVKEIESETRKMMIKTDHELMMRVLVNLLSNSIKAAPKESKILIQIGLKDSKTILLSVVNKGPGISPDMIHAIFDKFVQVEAKERGMIRGSGLGLAFCKEAIQVLGGKIWAESKPDHGTTVKIELPIVPPDY